MRPIAELEQRHGYGHDESQHEYVKNTGDVVQRQLGIAERLLQSEGEQKNRRKTILTEIFDYFLIIKIPPTTAVS